MTYATLSQLTQRYGAAMLVAVTDRGDAAPGEIDAEVVARALADTDAMIDGHLAVRYRLPLAQVPPLVTDLALMVAIWKLHPYSPDPKIEADYKGAVRALQEIADGRLRLPLDGIEPSGIGGTGARITDRARPLTAETMKGFI